MKRLFALGWVGLLTGCYQASVRDLGTVAKCPDRPASLPYINLEARQRDANLFNYQILGIEAAADNVTFQSRDRNFVYCRRDSSWTIQPGTYTEGAADDYFSEPSYQTIQLTDRSYQYRVRLEPIPTLDFTQEPQREQVVFELIAPNQQLVTQVLYTLKQAKQLETAVSLGFPYITAALSYDHRLFWAVSPEQGEGNGGVATIVAYDPQTEKIAVIQPEEISDQQINDLAITGEPDSPTFWIATQMSGEGNPYLPGMGLVAYRPDSLDYQTGTVNAYHVRNSALVGAIPTALAVAEESLWVGTGNGMCQVQWQAAENSQSWNCWRLALMAALPEAGVPLYKSLFAQSSQSKLVGETAEVLWWTPQSFEAASQGRYEVKYLLGFTVTLDNQGGIPWSEVYLSPVERPSWQSPLFWEGQEWHWNGKRFERGFDEVALNLVGDGPSGISKPQFELNLPPIHYAIRGDLDLLKLTETMTEVRYYSGWVEDELLTPYLAVVPQEKISDPEPNPLAAIAN